MSFKCAGASGLGHVMDGVSSCKHNQPWVSEFEGRGIILFNKRVMDYFLEAGFSYRIMRNACPAL